MAWRALGEDRGDNGEDGGLKLVSLEEGKKIVKIAREAIEKYLEEGERLQASGEVPEKLREDRGVFVTLNKKGNLRGCIGRPLPNQPFVKGLVNSAISAATRDPRFPSLEPDELDEITVEVSVLTVPEEVEVESTKKYPEKIQVGRDGLIVSYKGRQGLLLPQVAVDNGWDVEEFLSQTCVKAGLSPDSWVEKDLTVERFSAQVFKEEEPEGKVVEESLSS